MCRQSKTHVVKVRRMLPGKTCVAGIQHMGRVSLGYYMSPRYDMFHRIGTFVAEQRCVLPKYDTCSY